MTEKPDQASHSPRTFYLLLVQVILSVVLVGVLVATQLRTKQEDKQAEAIELQLKGLDAEIDHLNAQTRSMFINVEFKLPKLQKLAALLDKSRVVATVLEKGGESAYLQREAQINLQLAQASDEDLREIGQRLTEVLPVYATFEILGKLPLMLPDRFEIVAAEIRPWLETQYATHYQASVRPLLRPYGSSIKQARTSIRRKFLPESRVRAIYIAPLISLLSPLPIDVRPIVMEGDYMLRSSGPLLGGGY
ncbi:hypothetical protein DTL42_08505 [Bremerella cremea]|uniref:Uncharacterized protein n=1 Tax=Bremerella cremea TaxID=1031537 RepID=A0A368KT61_9BACT|nr:hypothetical protein [Bremerella cremea]RCS52860.1 hypothetical protein DTL42_08505 [Bremerella cremea]